MAKFFLERILYRGFVHPQENEEEEQQQQQQEGWARKTLSSVLKRASLPSPSRDMYDLRAKNYWTGTRKGTRTITAAVNRTSIITLRLSDCKSQASLTLFIRHHELTNENVSYFENEEIIFIDLKVTRKPNQLNIADDLILMRFLRIAFMK